MQKSCAAFVPNLRMFYSKAADPVFTRLGESVERGPQRDSTKRKAPAFQPRNHPLKLFMNIHFDRLNI